MSRLISYYLLMALAGALGIVKGVWLAKLLGVEGFGAFGLAVVLGGAFQFAIGLGAVEGLAVALPKYFAAGQVEAVSRCVKAATRMVLLRAALIAGAGLGVFSAIGHAPLALAALLGLANTLTTIPMVLARSQGNLDGFGLRMFVKALFTLGCSVAGGVLAGASGAVTGEFTGLMAAVLLTWGRNASHATLPLGQTPAQERELRTSGWPLLMQGVNVVAQQNIERWAVAATLGLAGAGKYGFAQLFVTAVNLVHATFFQQAGSRVLPRMAAGEPARQINLQLLRFAAILGAGTLIVLATLAPWASDLLTMVFPSFGDFTWGLIWLGAAAIAQMLHHFDWVLIGRAEQHLVERIAWFSTGLTIALCAIGFLFKLSLDFFLFSYFAGRLSILLATFGVAWTNTPRASRT